jgi:hypothetical protein
MDKAASLRAWLQSLRICVSSAPPLLPDTCQSLSLLAVRKYLHLRFDEILLKIGYHDEKMIATRN